MPNDKEIAALGLQFLQRVQLNGAEAPALIAVCDLLRKVADGSHLLQSSLVAGILDDAKDA